MISTLSNFHKKNFDANSKFTNFTRKILNQLRHVRITGSGSEVDFECQEAFIECLPRHQTRVEVRPNLGLTCITRQVHVLGVDDEGERIQNISHDGSVGRALDSRSKDPLFGAGSRYIFIMIISYFHITTTHTFNNHNLSRLWLLITFFF